MSILNPIPTATPDYAALAADKIREHAQQTFQTITHAFNNGAKLFWQHPRVTPLEIAAALGADAKEVFELHGKLGALIASVKPEAIAPGMAVIGGFTYNADGTVTVVPQPPASDANGANAE
jgi:hypothetical protein